MPYTDFWRRWKDFSGKTCRGDFWTVVFTHIILSFFLMIIACLVLVTAFDLTAEAAMSYFNIFWTIYGYVWLVPFLAMTVRRFRDAGYHKKNFWKLFIPGVGVLALFLPSFDECNDET